MSLPNWSQAREDAVADRIWAFAVPLGIDPALAFGLVALESGFNPTAVREEPRLNDASRGLTQILYGTAYAMGFRGTPDQLFDVEINLSLGLTYLRQMIDRWGSVEKGLSAYNGGLRGGVITNQSYVDGVLARASYFQHKWDAAQAPDDGTVPSSSSSGTMASSDLVKVLIGAGVVGLAWSLLRRVL